MRALIVDDEPVARKILREELEVMNSVEVVGEADNGEAALSQLASLKPDLLFLDIHMPGMSGFELLERLSGGHLPAIVMITAYDQHAIRAFEAGAVDYLLKPISHQRLVQAVEHAKRLFRNPGESAEIIAHLQELAPARGLARKGPENCRKVRGRVFPAGSGGGASFSGRR